MISLQRNLRFSKLFFHVRSFSMSTSIALNPQLLQEDFMTKYLREGKITVFTEEGGQDQEKSSQTVQALEEK